MKSEKNLFRKFCSILDKFSEGFARPALTCLLILSNLTLPLSPINSAHVVFADEYDDLDKILLKAVSDAPDPFSAAVSGQTVFNAQFEARKTNGLDANGEDIHKTFFIDHIVRLSSAENPQDTVVLSGRTFVPRIPEDQGEDDKLIPVEVKQVWDGRNADNLFVPDGNYVYDVAGKLIRVKEGDAEKYDVVGISNTLTGTIVVDNTAPVISNVQPVNGSILTTPLPEMSGTFADNLSGVNVASVRILLDGAIVTTANVTVTGFNFVPSAQLIAGDHTLVVQISDNARNTSQAEVHFNIRGLLPPDPATVAPPPDPTIANTMDITTAFLYTGSNPIQTGVAPEIMEPQRAAVVRGRVLQTNNSALDGVTITIVNHPEFGQTLSRADGMFDVAVNGGGDLTVRYEKGNYLSAQRTINVPWQDYVVVDDVVMTEVDPVVNTITLGIGVMQVAQGSVELDADGQRQATILFPAGTAAQMVLPDGTTQNLLSMDVRATEYTVGENGLAAMPAPLPPTTGYTYAVNLTADEALAAGAKTIIFNQPVYFYVDNFLGMPTGIIVPVGYYDYDKAAWIPSENGKVIKILGVTAGLADVDVDGTGLPASESALNAIGMTTEERTKLASLYSFGQTLWRVPIKHFTPYDLNYGMGPEPGAVEPQQPEAIASVPVSCPIYATGSIIECENQALGEAIEVVGTPYTLHYQSSRMPGRKDAYRLDIPLSGETVPSVLRGIDLEITVAGRVFKQSFPPQPNQRYTFIWDGKDAYGRTLPGFQTATVRIGYVYDGYYLMPPALSQSFGAASGQLIPGDIPARQQVTLWQEQHLVMGGLDILQNGLDGWTISEHHTYIPFSGNIGGTLFLGNGTQRNGQDLYKIIKTMAGSGTPPYPGGGYFSGDGGLATEAGLWNPRGATFGPDGSMYIVDTENKRIRKVDTDGIITTVVGNGEWPSDCGVVGNTENGDNGPAAEARIRPYGSNAVAFGPDGNLYIADTGTYSVRRVDANGIITTVAGNGCWGYGGDGGPATEAQLYAPYSIAFGPDGSLYIADIYNLRIRRVDPSGIITTVAGNGFPGHSGNGGSATEARLYYPIEIAVGPEGSLYILEINNTSGGVRRVGLDGIITTEETGPVRYPLGMSVDSEGSLYIADSDNDRILRVHSDKTIKTVAGKGSRGSGGDGGPATDAQFYSPQGVTIGPNGGLYISDFYNNRIRQVKSPLPEFEDRSIVIPSEDGSTLFQFNAHGKHFFTFNALTGTVLYQFNYDAKGLLIGIQDADGNMTTIERDGNGNPLAIVAPDGQRTELALDANGYLASIKNSANETVNFSYTNDGLLTSMTDAKGNTSLITYDADGRLIKDTNAAGGFWQLARTNNDGSFMVTKTSALNRITSYLVENLSTGDQRRVITDPAGLDVQTLRKTNGETTTTSSDGTITNIKQGPDPRFGMQSPIVEELKITTPAGLTLTQNMTRSVTLVDPKELLSVASLIDKKTLNGRISTNVYNALTKTWTATSPAGRHVLTTIDSAGRPVTQTITGIDPFNLNYDTRGRLAGITQGSAASQRTTQMAYNAQGYLAQVTDPLGRVTTYAHDLAGRVTQKTFPDGRQINYTYDANGNLESIIPPGRPAHQFTYTPVNLTEDYIAPNVGAGTTTSYLYNLDKQLTRVTRPDGQMLHLNYDTAGRLNAMTTPRGTSTYAYHPATGNFSGISAPGGVGLNFTYDGALPLSTVWNGPVSGSVTNAFDNNFRVVSMNVNGANPIAFGYDNDGLLTSAGSLAIVRNAGNGLPIGTTLGNVTDALTYSSFGEPQSYTALVSGAQVFKTEYTRDALGRITRKVETIGGLTNTYDYTYDAADRLAQVVKDGAIIEQYTYDTNGNRSGGTYDNQDRLLSYGSNTYAYTANGELLTKTSAGQTTTYDYDLLGNLMSVALPNGTNIEYIVDGQNRRIGKKVNGTLIQGFLYQSQLNPVAELDGSGSVMSRFVYGTRGNVPDYMIKGGVTYRIISDHLGSPRLIVDTATGTIVQRIDYDSFGNIVSDTNPGFQPFGFAAGLYDQHTKLTRFGARDYDAEVGRWTSKDPILFDGGDTNLYGYVFNDPVNWMDPFGLCTNKSGWDAWSDFVAPDFNDPTSFGANFWKELYSRPPSLSMSITFGGMTGTFATSGLSGSFTPTQLWGFGIGFQNRANLTNTMLYYGANEKLSIGFYPFDPGQWWEKSLTVNIGVGVGTQAGVDWQINPDRGLK